MGFDEARYTALLLKAMGLKPLSPSADPRAWALRALFSPTFHRDCCLTLVADAEGPWTAIEWTVLHSGTRSAIMHELGFRGFAPLSSAESALGVALHELADVERGPLSRLMAVVQAVDPYSLPSDSAHGRDTGRDGMPVRCESQRGPLVHRFTTWSPTQKHDPQHHRYLTALLDAAQSALRDPQSQRSLADVRGYLR
ncbi:MAG TPA: hypothetical protein PKI03_20020 [Pseudomonadota bacterium]|nr:hypothetical protein [Pseudomonadota bacterium]